MLGCPFPRPLTAARMLAHRAFSGAVCPFMPAPLVFVSWMRFFADAIAHSRRPAKH
jgi:hypothetical protein